MAIFLRMMEWSKGIEEIWNAMHNFNQKIRRKDILKLSPPQEKYLADDVKEIKTFAFFELCNILKR
jgi:hypothetical protein